MKFIFLIALVLDFILVFNTSGWTAYFSMKPFDLYEYFEIKNDAKRNPRQGGVTLPETSRW